MTLIVCILPRIDTRIAIKGGKESLTYNELATQADVTAQIKDITNRADKCIAGNEIE
ncbi:hypothetical protein Q4519_05300 [Motilimonas sp. 1_MG-2023]|uniref:hypothetical protein n=1 Tax=Motilimonas sp. 1_MG-2023 TaxID=3062672 RepID=UPI0026E2B061|nr:hypothetical protein [Motilimonas sp. 1_MG-2023]MDO6525093.1 hypothetical protein [Motilimonas sp. 1_MG-2023]